MEHSQSKGSQVKLWLNRIDLNAWVRHKPRGMEHNTSTFTHECRHKHKLGYRFDFTMECSRHQNNCILSGI